jgi:hypothetical protein
MLRATEALRLIDEQGQRSGLTERVQSYLVSSGPSTESGTDLPPRESAHRDAPMQELPPPVHPSDADLEPDPTGPALDED